MNLIFKEDDICSFFFANLKDKDFINITEKKTIYDEFHIFKNLFRTIILFPNILIFTNVVSHVSVTDQNVESPSFINKQ